MKSFLLLFVGLLSGVAMTLSCDDDSPAAVDAAPVCDCPTAEPPLTQQRIVEVFNEVTLPPATSPSGGRDGTGAVCPGSDNIALSGWCDTPDGQDKDIALVRFGGTQRSWGCYWRNNTNVEVVMRATVRCLVVAK